MGNLSKQAVDIITALCGSLEKIHPVPVGKVFANVCRNLMIVSVYFVPNKDAQNL